MNLPEHLETLGDVLRRFQFQDAFVDSLGWDHQKGGLKLLEARGRTFLTRTLARKGGVTVIEVREPDTPEGEKPLTSAKARSIRDVIQSQLPALYGTSIIAFVNQDETECYWRFPRGDSKGGYYPERRYYRDRTPIAPLLSVLKNLHVEYELQDDMGDVPHALMLDKLAASSAQADKVTAKFFKEFDKSRKEFEKFLKWVDDEKQRKWYVTALLNRVMFIYFLQERGLLPDKNQYLNHRLTEWQLRGTNRFYREFLLPLCFFGFGAKQGERGKFEEDFKGVPYLDGGLFEVHAVEEALGITREAVIDGTLPANIVIPDAEFQRWFQFLGSWRWTLDENNPDNEREINPGILGYIFEKYINQRELGAYYTKEDITGYICRNTIIPRLFDMLAETGSRGKKAIEPLPIGPHPNLLNGGKGISQGQGIDRYIWDAVKTTEYLPAETEREYATRQERYASILQDFEDGKIRTINDGVTYNLDLETLAQDFVLTIQDPALLWDFYRKCLKQITILDPTVGSGAFLLAAVQILYPLYEAALARMDHFWGTRSEGGSGVVTWKGELSLANDVDTQLTFIEPATEDVLRAMRTELTRIRDEHANAEYFIHKTMRCTPRLRHTSLQEGSPFSRSNSSGGL